MDTNQERRDKCKVCNGWLPKRKTKFCSDLCARRFRARKFAYRYPKSRQALTVDLLHRVSEVTWVPRAEQAEVAQPNGIYPHGERFVLVVNGRMTAYGPRADGGQTAMQKSLGARRQRLTEARKAEREAKREAERIAAARVTA